MVIMRNFTVKNIDLNGLLIAVATDETGADWYASQKFFQPDTLKLVFEKNGVIVSMHHDVSALWPGEGSVAEVATENIPDGFCLNGKWVFDGIQIKPRTYTAAEWQKKADEQRQVLLKEAAATTTDWRTELQLDVIAEDDKVSLIKWMAYIKELKELNLNNVTNEGAYNKIAWPKLES